MGNQAGGLPLVALLAAAGLAHDYWRMQRLPRLATPERLPAEQPLVSLLIPARNEARSIGRCLAGALAQSYAPYEVVVVDDHSSDDTAAIVARYAAQDTRLRLVRSAPLPPGWMGKCHACQQASDHAHAQSEWLLFLDADTAPAPHLLAALLTTARQQQLDMLTLFPFLELKSFWERLILPPFIALLHATFPMRAQVPADARAETLIANGQCIFVRRSAYNALGGHAAVAGDIIDDVMLARALHRGGFRIGAAVADDAIRVRMYTNGREVLEGLTKNASSGLQSGGPAALLAGTRQFALALLPPLLAAAGLVRAARHNNTSAALPGLVLWAAAVGMWGALLRQRYALSPAWGLLWPAGLMAYGLITLRSVWLRHRGRGLLWKGRTYAGLSTPTCAGA